MTNTYNFADYYRNMFDYNQLFAMQRRNLEALTSAYQIMVEGAQAAGRRNAEVARDNAEQVLKASREAFSGGAPEANVSRQAECSRNIVENTFSCLRETSETMTKCGFEAFDVLNRRAAESLEELSKAAGSASAPAPRSRKAA